MPNVLFRSVLMGINVSSRDLQHNVINLHESGLNMLNGTKHPEDIKVKAKRAVLFWLTLCWCLN